MNQPCAGLSKPRPTEKREKKKTRKGGKRFHTAPPKKKQRKKRKRGKNFEGREQGGKRGKESGRAFAIARTLMVTDVAERREKRKKGR